jgi:predicted GIY-YIG superfamily endonuclease
MNDHASPGWLVYMLRRSTSNALRREAAIKRLNHRQKDLLVGPNPTRQRRP